MLGFLFDGARISLAPHPVLRFYLERLIPRTPGATFTHSVCMVYKRMRVMVGLGGEGLLVEFEQLKVWAVVFALLNGLVMRCNDDMPVKVS